MSEVKLTKNELRMQQSRLTQLQKYLPTLQLKKSLLQSEVNEVKQEIFHLEEKFHHERLTAAHEAGLLSEQMGIDLTSVAKISEIKKSYENIAGIEIPRFEEAIFEPFSYPLFSTPAWLDGSVNQLRAVAIAKARVVVAQEKKEALEKELREVTIRVNLFEKNLIPRALSNIKKIKVFLGDQQLAAVSQAKVAKAKIEERKTLKALKKRKAVAEEAV